MGRGAASSIAVAFALVAAALASATHAQGGGPTVPRLADANGSRLTLVPTPDWVVENDLPDPSSYQFDPVLGVRYLLYDRQHDATLESATLYTRAVSQATSVVGVTQISQLVVPFDPAYQALQFHHVRVIRDGVVEDRRESVSYDVLRREQLLELQTVTGRMTASLRLNDIRVGDIVDIAFSASGVPMTFEGRDARFFPLALSTGVERLALRTRWPRGSTVALRGEGVEVQEARGSDGSILYTLPARPSPAAKPESYAPPWEPVIPFLTASSYRDWTEVASWGRPLYEVESGSQIAALAEQIRNANPEPRDRIVAALRFVQEQIRYFALTLGDGGYVPTSTAETLRTRTGDCKAKTLLLLSLLEALDVEAHAAFVNIIAGRALPLYAPSPSAFDHVIVRVRHEGKDYWLDPTALFQGGDLDALAQAQPGYALLLDGQTPGLVEIARRERSTPDMLTRDTFDVSRGPQMQGRLRRETTYSGRLAESLRAVVAATSPADLDATYSTLIAARYGAELVAPTQVIDDIDANTLTVVAEFLFDEPFKVDNQNPNRRTFQYKADLISSPVPDPRDEQESRRWPILVLADGSYRHEIVIKLPDIGKDWSLETGTVTIENTAFRFSRTLALEDARTYTLEAELDPLAETVSPSELAAVLQDQERMSGLARREIWINPNARPFLPDLDLPKIDLDEALE